MDVLSYDKGQANWKSKPATMICIRTLTEEL